MTGLAKPSAGAARSGRTARRAMQSAPVPAYTARPADQESNTTAAGSTSRTSCQEWRGDFAAAQPPPLVPRRRVPLRLTMTNSLPAHFHSRGKPPEGAALNFPANNAHDLAHQID